ncbi:oligosaccharide flippase family protein [Opacimonas viscosa]|uniref:Oligosaccharide flippase family protein n=1 Tax=Opacimonas viscosa TaxID=2961944 RepID=A0AA41WXS7_9ALTE|nr:oligosaccharide flippase family protein [Opacimonas viscosa]MCP3428494.1 oligosaccharide flippase family protein [Opacimonas viscosa]
MNDKKILLQTMQQIMSNNFVVKALGILSLVIIARLLSPEDFGIIAIASSITFLADVLSESGTQRYINHKKKIKWSDIHTAYTINIITKCIVIIGVITICMVIYSITNNELLIVISLCSLIIILNSINNPVLILLKRELRYECIIKCELITKVFSVLCSIILVFFIGNFWALVLSIILTSIFQLVISYLWFPNRFGLGLSNYKFQITFVKLSYAQSVVGYLRSEIDIIISSFFFSATEIGHYSKNKELATIPGRDFIRPVTEPVLRYFVNNSIEKETPLLDILKIMMTFSVPLSSLFFLYHNEIVVFILGDNWSEYSYLFSYFMIFVFQFSIYSIIEEYLIANDKIKRLVIFEWWQFFILFSGLLLIGQFEDISFYALFRSFFSVFSLLFILRLVTIVLDVPFGTLLMDFMVLISFALLSSLLVFFCDFYFLIEIVIFLMVYFSCLFLMDYKKGFF